MKILYYLGSLVAFLTAIGEILPIYLISSGFLHGNIDNSDQSHFAWKLAAHLLFLVMFACLGIFLIKKVKSIYSGSEEKNIDV